MKINNTGLTLLEIIIIITILAFAIPSALIAFSRIVGTGASTAYTTVAANLAEEKMEEIIKGKRYADIISVSQTNFTGSFSEYNYEIVVDYVSSADFNTPYGSPSDFKRVQSIITKDGMSGVNVTVSTIITNIGY